MNILHKKNRIMAKIKGSTNRPRLSATITNKNVVAQIIDDVTGKTLVYTTTVNQDIKGSLLNKAEWAGTDIAKKAKKAKISKVVFDRRSHIYHGRLKALADAARKSGLEF